MASIKLVLVAVTLASWSGPVLAQDATHGADVFSTNCSTCHSIAPTEKNMMGPSLFGIVGRKAGTRPNYTYSPAMAGFGREWSAELLATYLADPKKLVPDNKMKFVGLGKPGDIADLVVFLSQQKPAD